MSSISATRRLGYRFAHLLVYLAVTFQLCRAQVIDPSNPQARLTFGNVQGSARTLANGRSIASFIGIPFAAAPTRGNRFRVRTFRTSYASFIFFFLPLGLSVPNFLSNIFEIGILFYSILQHLNCSTSHPPGWR